MRASLKNMKTLTWFRLFIWRSTTSITAYKLGRRELDHLQNAKSRLVRVELIEYVDFAIILLVLYPLPPTIYAHHFVRFEGKSMLKDTIFPRSWNFGMCTLMATWLVIIFNHQTMLRCTEMVNRPAFFSRQAQLDSEGPEAGPSCRVAKEWRS